MDKFVSPWQDKNVSLCACDVPFWPALEEASNMFFFFHTPLGGQAAAAFKEAAKAQELTYQDAAERLGVGKSVLAKFVGGRPPSARLLKAMLKHFPEPHSQKILIGYLNDELVRLGLAEGERIAVVQKTRHTYLLDQVARLLAERPDRAGDLVKLLDSWQAK